jgi:curved DNA-binding protein CbpA
MAAAADPYRALGVARGATDADIKKAHRRLAKRYHPDAPKGDEKRFLVIQEAYRVLSDALLRREWDARHAPGPIRATTTTKQAPTNRTQPKSTRSPRRARADTAGDAPPPVGPRPRSTRSYTWSASEVPWWEEGLNRKAAKRPKKAQSAQSEPSPERPQAPDFEVYNRSSGAAWSMASRAYFRKTDADLPSRGVFRHNGAQPLTAGKARAAAEADALRDLKSRRPDKP